LHCRHSISGFLLGGRAAQPDGMVRRCAVAHHGSTSYRTVCDTTIQWMTRSMAGHPGVWTTSPPASIARRAGRSCGRASPICGTGGTPARPRSRRRRPRTRGPPCVPLSRHGAGRSGSAELYRLVHSTYTRTYSCKRAARMDGSVHSVADPGLTPQGG
jgi:hypothetical protein